MSTDRRTFVTRAAAAVAALATAGGLAPATAPGAAFVPRRREHDLVLRGGTVVDGTGSSGVVRDVAVSGGRITGVSATIAERGREELDVRGLTVAPGFIDIHSHAEGSLADDPRAASVIRQGVTTIVAGQDGSSRGGEDPGDFIGWLRSINDLKPAIHVAAMIGLGTVRGAVVGNRDRAATVGEIARMKEIVRRAIDGGACGASSGLEYTPGAFATTEELTEVCRPLAERGLPYATHMRNEDDRLLDSIRESITVAKGAGCPLQISHLKTQGPRNWPRLDEAFALIESARRNGLNVAFDRYPYVAYSTGLTNLFPVWSRDGGTAGFLARLDDANIAQRIRAETLAKVDLIGGWDNVMVTNVRAPGDRDAEGKRLGSWAGTAGADPYDAAVGLLRRSNASVGMVGFAMSEENLDRILAHPLGMVCSDGGGFAIEGPTRRGSPHPRGLGSFPRVLGRYVRERKALTLEQAVHKMSGFPASRIGLRDRGRIAVGMQADICVFDAATVSDTATFEQPFSYPRGVRAVVVKGALVLDGERQLDVRNGLAARPVQS